MYEKNILILPTAYPNIYNDHSSIFVQDQARALAKHEDTDISVLGAIPISFKDIWKKKVLKFGYFEYKRNDVNVKLFLFPAIPKLKRLNNFVRYILNRKLITKYIKSSKIDLIHVHNATAGEVAIWAKHRYQIPYCVTEHSSAFARGMLTEDEIKRYGKIYRNASYNMAVSKMFCLLLEDLYHMKFHYIPNVVDTDYFKPSIQKDRKYFQFVNIANLNKNKNQILLIKAFYDAFKDKKEIKLSILGGGPEYEGLHKEISDLHMQDQIILYGFARRDEVRNILQYSDVFVLSSKYETFGVVVLEAMSCGLPVVTTRCGGPESIMESDELGVLVENGNLEGLSKAMKSMYKNLYKYNSDSIRSYVVNNFSEVAISNKLIDIYKKVINE